MRPKIYREQGCTIIDAVCDAAVLLSELLTDWLGNSSNLEKSQLLTILSCISLASYKFMYGLKGESPGDRYLNSVIGMDGLEKAILFTDLKGKPGCNFLLSLVVHRYFSLDNSLRDEL